MADLQTLKRLGINGDAEATRKKIAELNKKDETIFNDLQEITNATRGMSQSDIVKATGVPFKEWQGIVAKFDKDRARIVSSPKFSKESFQGKLYPGKGNQIDLARASRGGQFASELYGEQERQRNPGNLLSRAGTGLLRGSGEDLLVGEYIKAGLDPQRALNVGQTDPIFSQARDFGSNFVQGALGTGTSLIGMAGGGKVADIVTKPLLSKPGIGPAIARGAIHFGAAVAGGEGSKALLNPYVNPRAKLPEDVQQEITAQRSSGAGQAGEKLSSLLYFGLGSRNPTGGLAFSSGAGIKKSAEQIIKNPALGMTTPLYRSAFDETVSRSALSGMSLFGDIQRNNQARESLKQEGVTNPTDQQLESAGGVKPSSMLTGVLWSTLLGKKTGLGNLLSGDFGLGGARPQKGLGPVAEPMQGGQAEAGQTYQPTPGTHTFGFGRRPEASPEQTEVNAGARATTSPRLPSSEFGRSWSFTGPRGTPQILRFNTNQPGAVIETWSPMLLSDSASLSKGLHSDLPTFRIDGQPSIKVLGMGINGEITLQRPGMFVGGLETVITNINQLAQDYPDIHADVVRKIRALGAVGGKDPDRYLNNIDPDAIHDYETDKNKNVKDDAFPYKVVIVDAASNRPVALNVRADNIDGDNVTVVTESGLTFVVHKENLLSPKDGEAMDELKTKSGPTQKLIKTVFSGNGLTVNNIPLWKLHGTTDADAKSAYKDNLPGTTAQRAAEELPVGTLLKIPIGAGATKHKAYVIGYGDLTGPTRVISGDDYGFGVYVKSAENPRLAPFFVPFRSIGATGQIEVVSGPTAAAPAPTESIPGTSTSISVPENLPAPTFIPTDAPSSPTSLAPVGTVDLVPPGAAEGVGGGVSPAPGTLGSDNPLAGIPEGDGTVDPAAVGSEGGDLAAGMPEGAIDAEQPEVESVFGDPEMDAAYADSLSRAVLGPEAVVALMNLDLSSPELSSLVDTFLEQMGDLNGLPPGEVFDKVIYSRLAAIVSLSANEGMRSLMGEGLGTTKVVSRRAFAEKPISELAPSEIEYVEVGPVDKAGLIEQGKTNSWAFRYYPSTQTYAIATLNAENNFEVVDSNLTLIPADQLHAYMPGIQESVLGTFSYYDAETLRKEIGIEDPKALTPIVALIDNTMEDYLNSPEASGQPTGVETGLQPEQPDTELDSGEDFMPSDSEDPGAGLIEQSEEPQADIDQVELFKNIDMYYNSVDPSLGVIDAMIQTINSLNNNGIAYQPNDLRDWVLSKLKAEKDPRYQNEWRQTLQWIASQMQTGARETPVEDAGKTQNKRFPYGEEFEEVIPEENLPNYLQGRDEESRFYGMTQGEQALKGKVQNVSGLTKSDAVKRYTSGPEGVRVRVWGQDTAKELIKFRGATNKTELKELLVRDWSMGDHEADLLSELTDRWIIGAAKEHLRIRGYQVNEVARARRQPGKDKILTPDQLEALDPDEQSWKDTHREQAILSMTKDNLDLLAKTVAQFYSERLGVFAQVGKHWMSDENNGGSMTFIQGDMGHFIPLMLVPSGSGDEVKFHEVVHTLMKSLPAATYHYVSTKVFDTDAFDQGNLKVTDTIPQYVEEAFVTRFINTMVAMSKSDSAGQKATFVEGLPVEGGYDDSFTNLLIKIGSVISNDREKINFAGIVRFPFINGRAYPAGAPVMINGQYGTLSKPVGKLTQDNIKKPRDIQITLKNGTEVTGKIINGDADFEIAEPGGVVFNADTRAAVEKIVGHGYDHISKAIAAHAPEVVDVKFNFYDFASRIPYAVGYRWYDSVDQGLTYYNEKQMPRDVNGKYIPMTENRMRQRIMSSNLGWLDKRWGDYAKQVGQQILSHSGLNPVHDDVLPYVTRKSFRSGAKPLPAPVLGTSVPNIPIQPQTPSAQPQTKIDVDTSWADELGEDGITFGKVQLSEYDVDNMTWGDIPKSGAMDELIPHPTERTDIDKVKLSQQTLVIAMELNAEPVVKLSPNNTPSVSPINRSISAHLGFVFENLGDPKRFGSYWKFQGEVASSVVNILNKEKITAATKFKAEAVARGLIELDSLSYPLVTMALDDLITSLEKWDNSGLYTNGLNSWASIIQFTKDVRGHFEDPAKRPLYKTADHYDAILKASTPVERMGLGELDNTIGGVVHSLIGNISNVNELLRNAKNGLIGNLGDKQRYKDEIYTLTNALRKLNAIEATIYARLNPESTSVSLSTDSAIREFYNSKESFYAGGIQPLAQTFQLSSDIDEDLNVINAKSEDEEILAALAAEQIDPEEWKIKLEELRKTDPEAASNLEKQLKSNGTFKQQVEQSLPDILKLVGTKGLKTAVLPIISSPYVAYITNRFSLLGARRYKSYIFLNLGTKNPGLYSIGNYTSAGSIRNIYQYRNKELTAQKKDAQMDLYQSVQNEVQEDIETLIGNMSYVPVIGNRSAHIVLTEYKPLTQGSTTKVLTNTKLSLAQASTLISRAINAASRRGTNQWMSSDIAGPNIDVGTYEERARQIVMGDIRWQTLRGTSDQIIQDESVYRAAVRGQMYAQRMGKNTSPIKYVTVDDFIADSDLHGNMGKEFLEKLKSFDDDIKEAVQGDYDDVTREAKLKNLTLNLYREIEVTPEYNVAPAFVYPKGINMLGTIKTASIQVITKLGSDSDFQVGINIPEVRRSDLYVTKIKGKTRAEYHEERYQKQMAGRQALATVALDDPFTTTDIASDQNLAEDVVDKHGINPIDKVVVEAGLNKLLDRNTFTMYGPMSVSFTLQGIDPNWFQNYQQLLNELKTTEAAGGSKELIDGLKSSIDAYDNFINDASGQLMRHVNDAMGKVVSGARLAHKTSDSLGVAGMHVAMREVLTNMSMHIASKPAANDNAQIFVKVLDKAFPGAMQLLRKAHDNGRSIESVLSGLVAEAKTAQDIEDLNQLRDIAFDALALHAMSENVKEMNDMSWELTSGTNMSAQFVQLSQTLTPAEYFHLTRIAFNRMLSPGTETDAITASDVTDIVNIGKNAEALDNLRQKMNASEQASLLNQQRGVNAPELYSTVFGLIDTFMERMLNVTVEPTVREMESVKSSLEKAAPEDQQGIVDAAIKTYLSDDKIKLQAKKRLPFKQFTTLEQTIELIHGVFHFDPKSPYQDVAKQFQKELLNGLGGKQVVAKFVKDLANSLTITPSGWIEDKWLPDVVVKKLDDSVVSFVSQSGRAFTHAGKQVWPYAYIGKIKDPLTAYTKILNVINGESGSQLNRTVLSDSEIRALASLHTDDSISLLEKNDFFNRLVDGRRLHITNPLKSFLALKSDEALQVTMGDLNNFMSDNNYSHADRIGALNTFISHMGETRNVLKSHVIAMGRMPLVGELQGLWQGDQDMRTKYLAKVKNLDAFKGKSDEEILDQARKVFHEDFKKLSDFVVSRNFANYLDMISVSELNVMSKGRLKLPVTGITLRTSANNVAINEIVQHGTFLAVSDVFQGNRIIADYLSSDTATYEPSEILPIIRAVRNDIARLNSPNITDLIWNPAKRIPGETVKFAGKGLVAPGVGKKATETELTTAQSSIRASTGADASPETIFVGQMRNAVANAFQRVLTDIEGQGVRLKRGVLPVSNRNGKALVSALTDQYKMQSNDQNKKLVGALNKFARAYVKSTLQGRQEFLKALNDDSLNVNRYVKDLNNNGAWTGIVRVENVDSGQLTKIIDYKSGQVFNADGSSAMVGQNVNGFNAAQAALVETFMELHPNIDLNVLKGAVLRATHLRTVPAEYWHGRQNLSANDDFSEYAEPMYATRARTSEYDVHEAVGTIDTTTREEFVKPTIQKWLAPNKYGFKRLQITSDGTPAYNGEGYHVLTPQNAYSHTYAKLLHAGLSPDKALEIYTLTEHPLFKSWVAGKFIDNVHMSGYGTLATQGRRLSPLNERKVRVVLRAKQLEIAANEYVKDKSKENYENLKFAFDEALGSGLTSEELNKKLNNITADKHDGVQFPLSLMANVETALQLAQPNMTSDIMSYVMPTVAYQSTAQRLKTGQPFTTLAFDYEGEGDLGYSSKGWKVHDLGSGLHSNKNVKNEARAIKMKNPLVYNAHQNGIDPVEMEEIIKRAFDQKRDGIVFVNVAEAMMSDSYKNIAITMNDANVKSVARMLLDAPTEKADVAMREWIEPMFMTFGPDTTDEKEQIYIDKAKHDPVWDLNTARNVPVLRFENPDYKMIPTSKEFWKDKSRRGLMWASAEYQQHVRARLGMDLALLNIHTGKASPLIAVLSGRAPDAIIWTKAAIASFKYTRPNTSVMFGNIRIGFADKAGRRAFVNRYLYWKNYEGGKYLEAFKAHGMNNIGLVQYETNVERSKAYHYQKINYLRQQAGEDLVDYDQIHLNLMDFDEQGFHAELYEQGTVQGMVPLVGLAARQIAAHSDEFVMQMVVSRIKADPELENMTAEELGKSDKVFKVMKFVSQMAGQFQYSTDEEKDALIGMAGKFMLNAPRWAASNWGFMYGGNQVLTKVLGKQMGERNRSIDIYVAPDWDSLKKGFKEKDPTVIWQMKGHLGSVISILLSHLIGISISRFLLQESERYLVRWLGPGKVRIGDWEYKDTSGYFDPWNKLIAPAANVAKEASKRPALPTVEEPDPNERILDAARPFYYQLSPVITSPINWFTGKDALRRNLYEPNQGANIAYNSAIKPLIERVTGQQMPNYMYVPRFHTDQWWSWINSGFDAIEKANEMGESKEKQTKIFWSSMALSAIGSGFQYNPEPDENKLEQFKLLQQSKRNQIVDKPISKASLKDLRIYTKD